VPQEVKLAPKRMPCLFHTTDGAFSFQKYKILRRQGKNLRRLITAMPAGSAIIAIPQAGLDKTKWKIYR
jgi:hypothetical protein